MKHIFCTGCGAAVAWWFLAVGVHGMDKAGAAPASSRVPPSAPVKVVADVYHGTTITDSYRYMEEFQSEEVQAWVKAQADAARHTLHSLSSRDALLARIVELDAGAPYAVFGVERQPNGDLFYFKQSAGENVAKIYLRDAASGRERMLIDPETFPKVDPNAHSAISFFEVSPDGAKLLYGFAASGSEQTTLKVYDLSSSSDLPIAIDRIEAEYAQPCWLPDSQSFVYSRRRLLPADAPAADGYKYTQAFRHRLGSDVESDELIFADGAAGSPKMDEMDFPAVIITSGSPWAIGQVKHGDETDLSLYAAPVANLGRADIRWTKVCGRKDLATEFVVHGESIYLMTAHQAPRFQVVRLPLANPDFAAATVVVPPGRQVVQSLSAARDALYVGVMDGVPRRILRVPYESPGDSTTVPLPAGEPSGGVAAASTDVDGVMIKTESWTRAGRLYHYSPQDNQLSDARLSPTGKFDSPDFITSREVLVASHDGVEVPLSIIHRADIRLDGTNPTLLSGYGAYGFTSPMRYSATMLAWLERGGVLAIAHVRGGGAFGKEWHHAGRKLTKPNTWKDFIACAEHLVKSGYTSPQRLAGQGGSAGGILVGRSITERPDLFAAAHVSVGCTEMLRFETTMNGPPNVPEFGTVKKPDEFQALLAMSTFHQIVDGTKYPAILLTHGINDPRVEPWLSAKTTARFQAATASGRPVLFRVDYHAGHGIGSTKRQRHEEQADVWSFLLWQFGDAAFAPR
ncbi:MAG: prolyl oligopeptidase family serine peptidase [Pirellulales bacterium]